MRCLGTRHSVNEGEDTEEPNEFCDTIGGKRPLILASMRKFGELVHC